MVRDGVELDAFVFLIVLKVCAALEDLNLEMKIHGYRTKVGLDSAVSLGIWVGQCSFFRNSSGGFLCEMCKF